MWSGMQSGTLVLSVRAMAARGMIMRRIVTEPEFAALRQGGVGLIYNDFSRHTPSGQQYNVLHIASCPSLKRANLNVDKYFSPDLPRAIAWLRQNRGPENVNWKRCDMCRGWIPYA